MKWFGITRNVSINPQQVRVVRIGLSENRWEVKFFFTKRHPLIHPCDSEADARNVYNRFLDHVEQYQ